MVEEQVNFDGESIMLRPIALVMHGDDEKEYIRYCLNQSVDENSDYLDLTFEEESKMTIKDFREKYCNESWFSARLKKYLKDPEYRAKIRKKASEPFYELDRDYSSGPD